ncbi:double-strand break repair protein AddB [Pararhodobacter sp.]|uniref:double-strand break repair protein AddB n=1 Tax=Pararhodobacter sp. TaxID=2127056 RepID=UPI002AFE68C7|nr:double-strand break repair protein AddB [Pararhodobacter sp.]
MFEAQTEPRVFGIAPGMDFPLALAQGLRARLQGQPPEAIARVEVIVNTARMQARLRDALIADGPGFLPRIRLIEDLANDHAPENPLRSRLALAQAIRALLHQEPDLGPTTAAFSLSDSLFRLLDEMQGEGVALDVLDQLDVSNHSDHWTRSLRFIRLITEFYGPVSGGQGRLRRAIEEKIAIWGTTPPQHPILVAGSTGSRGPSSLLMQAVARLPQGALVLPGFDAVMPSSVWHGFDDPLHNEDHPQFRYARLTEALNMAAADVRRWTNQPPPNPSRNALVSLALRPAPVTDQWLRDGPALGDLTQATDAITLIEASGPRQEALSIALCLRQAAVDGKKAALITPDRVLARRVTAALDGWNIHPDDSAGRPLALSAPGRYLRLCAELLNGTVSSEALVALLKHPITHSASDRGPHLRHLRDLELHVRRRAIPYPDAETLAIWAARKEDRGPWVEWLNQGLSLLDGPPVRPLADWIATQLRFAEHMAMGAGGANTGELWKADAGDKARTVFDELREHAAYGGEMQSREFSALLDTVFVGKEVRETIETRANIMIWGTLEARAQGADLIILGGLVEGTWPASPQPDPWFNRQMRHDAGLLLPERQIGLSAHDFQLAIAGAEVVLSRAKRNAEAETVPSRWLNRLTNLIGGLPAQNGPDVLKAMRARGQRWIEMAQLFDADLAGVPEAAKVRNPRPAPAPPVSARPKELSVTRIEKLVRDPYAIYAEYVLKLRRLDPLAPEPDARVKGTVIHRVLDEYVQQHPPGTSGNVQAFLAIAETVLAEECPWQAVRLHWLARLQQTAAQFVAWNAEIDAELAVSEKKARLVLTDPPFVLTGKPDRIDRTPDGQVQIYDYKTGQLPTKKQQAHFNKQLVLLAIMAEDGAFEDLGPVCVSRAEYVGLGAAFKQVAAPIGPEDLAAHRKDLAALLREYGSAAQGYTAMRAVATEDRIDDYHPLARRGEWQPSDASETIPVGDHDA